MNWKFISSGSNNGKFNMDYDIELAEQCGDNNAVFRLYRWNPYCISLGANQKFSDLNAGKARNDGLDIVKRPTGGRAILHSEELTYSVIFPRNSGLSSLEIYHKISLGLISGLKLYSDKLSVVELESSQPDFPKLLKENDGLVCFSSTAKNEVKYKGLKLIGSAQRRMKKAILQHGSILCGDHHANLINYLQLPDEEITRLHQELRSKTTNLKYILNEEVDYIELAEALIEGFSREWKIKMFVSINA